MAEAFEAMGHTGLFLNLWHRASMMCHRFFFFGVITFKPGTVGKENALTELAFEMKFKNKSFIIKKKKKRNWACQICQNAFQTRYFWDNPKPRA